MYVNSIEFKRSAYYEVQLIYSIITIVLNCIYSYILNIKNKFFAKMADKAANLAIE